MDEIYITVTVDVGEFNAKRKDITALTLSHISLAIIHKAANLATLREVSYYDI